MTVEPGDVVMIGDELATSEELLAGPGTYDDGATIRAARVGTFKIDTDEFAAKVDAHTPTPIVLQQGDHVIGSVYIVKEQMTGINVVARADAPHKNISGETEGTLHVARMADRYVSSMEDEFKKDDIVRARVTQGTPSLQLETKGKGLGVIKALCTKCRHELVRKPKTLECTECGHKEYRYIAEDYGAGNLMPNEDDFVPRDLTPPARGGGGRGGGRGGPRGGGGRGGPPRGGRGGDRGGGRGGGRGGDRGGRGGRSSGGGRGGDRGGGGRGGGGRGGGDRGGRSSGGRGSGGGRGRGRSD